MKHYHIAYCRRRDSVAMYELSEIADALKDQVIALDFKATYVVIRWEYWG